jgi:hypothetical protein
MTIQNLPVEYRPVLNEILKNARAHAIFSNPIHSSLLHFLNGMIDFLDTKELVYDQFELFLFDTAKHDRANNTLMQHGNKKLYDQLTDRHRQVLQDFYTDLSADQLEERMKQIIEEYKPMLEEADEKR